MLPIYTYQFIYEYKDPKMQMTGGKGAAIIAAGDESAAYRAFREQYTGQYHTIDSCKKIG